MLKSRCVCRARVRARRNEEEAPLSRTTRRPSCVALRGPHGVLQSHSLFTCGQGDEGIVGLSYQYKDDNGNMVAISRGKVKDAKRQFAHQVQLRLCMQCNPNISVKVFKTGRLQVQFSLRACPCVQRLLHPVGPASCSHLFVRPCGAALRGRHGARATMTSTPRARQSQTPCAVRSSRASSCIERRSGPPL